MDMVAGGRWLLAAGQQLAATGHQPVFYQEQNVADWFAGGNLAILLSCLAGWFLAQAVKAVIEMVRLRQFNLVKAVFATGGMPSAHAASVSALASAIFLHEGLSTAFAVALILMFVTLRDAVGVRLAVSDHAQRLNELAIQQGLSTPPLPINIGHTPTEVLVGVITGMIAAVVISGW